MRRDPKKTREWQRRGAEKYAKRQREEGRKPLPPKNEKRAAVKFADAFHSRTYVKYVHGYTCSVPGCRREDIVCAHVEKTRKNGGKWFEIAPLCGGDFPGHHQEQEGKTEAFNQKYGIDLRDIAAQVALRFKILTKEEGYAPRIHHSEEERDG